jgi:hypothetical protein
MLSILSLLFSPFLVLGILAYALFYRLAFHIFSSVSEYSETKCKVYAALWMISIPVALAKVLWQDRGKFK